MEDLRDELINIINNSNLPIEGVYYIFKDVFRELTDQYSLVLKERHEKKNLDEAITKEEKKED